MLYRTNIETFGYLSYVIGFNQKFIKADSLYKYNSTKTFDSKTELYWDEMEEIWFCQKVGKLGIEYLPLWKNFSILYHIHGILNLVLAGNSNVVEITKESCNYTKNLPLLFDLHIFLKMEYVSFFEKCKRSENLECWKISISNSQCDMYVFFWQKSCHLLSFTLDFFACETL